MREPGFEPGSTGLLEKIMEASYSTTELLTLMINNKKVVLKVFDTPKRSFYSLFNPSPFVQMPETGFEPATTRLGT